MKDDSVYLRHILEAIERILSYTSGGAETFRGDPKTQEQQGRGAPEDQ